MQSSLVSGAVITVQHFEYEGGRDAGQRIDLLRLDLEGLLIEIAGAYHRLRRRGSISDHLATHDKIGGVGAFWPLALSAPLGTINRSTPTASNGPFGPVPRATQRTNITSRFVACSIGSARKSGMKSSRSMMRLAYSCGPRTGRVVRGQYPAMSCMAIAGTLASTRALFGFIQVFPQSSIRYGPRCFCDSPSVLPGDIRSVSAAPVTVSETARRTLASLVADMVRLLCCGHGA